MNAVDFLILFCFGYTCGCASLSAYPMKILIANSSKNARPLLAIISVASAMAIGFAAILLFSFFVIGEKPGLPNFGLRSATFVISLLLGMLLTFKFGQHIEKRENRSGT